MPAFIVQGSAFWVLGSGFSVLGSGFWVLGSGFKGSKVQKPVISVQRSAFSETVGCAKATAPAGFVGSATRSTGACAACRVDHRVG